MLVPLQKHDYLKNKGIFSINASSGPHHFDPLISILFDDFLFVLISHILVTE